jgi:hypothetical protein
LIVAVDLPSGISPQQGFVGDAVTADVTVSLGPPWAGVFLPGLAPFIGDLHAVGAGGELIRLVGRPDRQ